MKKKTFYTELAYAFALISLAFGAALMEKADFGVSMVVAPAYILYLKLSQFFPFFTFGMAEYTLQAVLLILMVLVLRKFRLSYLFSFITAVIYGFLLDGAMAIVALASNVSFALRIIFFCVGLLLSATGVSLMFHTYISPEVYELFVKEVSKKFNLNINKFKTGYDCVSCAVSIIMSFSFFGLLHFEGVKTGTVICAFLNGFIISRLSHLFERYYTFQDKLPFRTTFETK